MVKIENRAARATNVDKSQVQDHSQPVKDKEE